MSQQLLFEFTEDSQFPLDENTPASGVYVILHDESGNALKLSGGAYSLTPFTAALQDGFAIQLVEHAQRTRYWSKTIASGLVTLPATGYGEYYTEEYWESPVSGGTGAVMSINRSTDNLITTKKLQWSGTRKIDSSLGKDQEFFEAHVSCAYEPSAATARFICWLEKDGQIVTDAASCTILWKKRDGTTLLNSIDNTDNAEGFFMFVNSSIQLDADTNTQITVTVVDADGDSHTTGGSLNHWD